MLDATIRECVDTPERPRQQPTLRCQAPSGSRPPWCVVASKPQAERLAHANLHRRGFEAYLPLVTVRWRDRTWHTTPLFPGYLFVRLDLAQPWNPVRYAPGVFQLLMTGDRPSICPEGAVEALQAAEAERAAYPSQEPPWRPGDAVSLRKGPMEGCHALVLSVGTDMALISLLMFGQLREVAVDVDCLKARGA